MAHVRMNQSSGRGVAAEFFNSTRDGGLVETLVPRAEPRAARTRGDVLSSAKATSHIVAVTAGFPVRKFESGER